MPHQSENVPLIALDIGGSLIKLVYFSKDPLESGGGKLHFVKFETSMIDDCMAFIESKRLHKRKNSSLPIRVKATGGGHSNLQRCGLNCCIYLELLLTAYLWSALQSFRTRLGIILEREDEMACMVEGCNFLLKAVRNEAFRYENGRMSFINIDPCTVYPYLLVNIGSGVSMVRVDGEGIYQRISGTNIGGGTFWGLCRLLTGCSSFDDILELSSRGDNSKVDMLVGDIYGGRDYASIGLSADTIASSFGKVLHSNKTLQDYNPSDIAMSLCRMISYNIGQLAYLNAKRYNLSRIFFGGFFIRGHPYTMDTISFAIRFWSQGEMGAMFLRHEGFLGAMGAFMQVHNLAGKSSGESTAQNAASEPGKVRSRFVERFNFDESCGSGDNNEDGGADKAKYGNWVDKFMETGRPATEAAKSEHEEAMAAMESRPMQRSKSHSISSSPYLSADPPGLQIPSSKLNIHVGVLHFTPTCEPFPLLADPAMYVVNTFDITEDVAEMAYWIGVLQDQIPTVMHKAASSEQNSKESLRRAAHFGRTFNLHLCRYRSHKDPFGPIGLSDLFELREECLREMGFHDVYKLDKERENAAALEALPELLSEIDRLEPPSRLLSLIQGSLAANIFDWGAQECVGLYYSATILEMYREARENLSNRPWRVDDLNEFAEAWLSNYDKSQKREQYKVPYRRAMIFVDNAGADVVLGMLPLARELLKGGCDVVLAANTLPAINDITCSELQGLVSKASEICPIIKAARSAAVSAQRTNLGKVPPPLGVMPRSSSATSLKHLSDFKTNVASVSGDMNPIDTSESSLPTGMSLLDEPIARGYELDQKPVHTSRCHACSKPGLYIVPNGQGSPCLDLSRISRDVADASAGTDLVIIEGMGRAIHTNLHVKLQCDTLKLAMIKNRHLAEKLFGGKIYDCVCRFDES